MAAIKRITDQAILANLAIKTSYYSISEAAVEKVNDPKLLVYIIQKGIYRSRAQVAAVKKVTDQNFLAFIAINGTDSDAQLSAVERITDQKLLADVAKNASNLEVRAEAARRITGQTVLAGEKCTCEANVAQNHSSAVPYHFRGKRYSIANRKEALEKLLKDCKSKKNVIFDMDITGPVCNAIVRSAICTEKADNH